MGWLTQAYTSARPAGYRLLDVPTGEHVADAVDRADERGPAGVGLQLAAEPGHVHVHGACGGHRVAAPGAVEQLVAAERRSLVLDEAAEELEHLRGHRDGPARPQDAGAPEVEFDPAELAPAGRGGEDRAAPEAGLDAGE